MKRIIIGVTLLFTTLFTNAQRWSGSLALGPAIYRDINVATSVGEEAIKEDGWSAELGINYKTKTRWTLGFGINLGQYTTERSYSGFGSPVYVKRTEEAYALCFSADYDLLRKAFANKQRKFSVTLGGMVAPVLYHEHNLTSDYRPTEASSKSAAYYLGLMVGAQARLKYAINNRLSIFIKPALQIDPIRFSNNYYVGSEADFRASLLLGSSIDLQ